MAKLVAAAAVAASGLVSGTAHADKVTGANQGKFDKWTESFKVYKNSTLKYMKQSTGFRVEIQANAELSATLRSMGLVPNADSGSVKLSIEFSNS